MDASGCSVLVLHVPANAGILMKPATMFWTNFWKIEFLPRADFAPSFTLTCVNIMGFGVWFKTILIFPQVVGADEDWGVETIFVFGSVLFGRGCTVHFVHLGLSGHLAYPPTRFLGRVYFKRIYKLCSMWACAPTTDRCSPDTRCCKYTIIQIHKDTKNKNTHFSICDMCSPDRDGGGRCVQLALQVEAPLQGSCKVRQRQQQCLGTWCRDFFPPWPPWPLVGIFVTDIRQQVCLLGRGGKIRSATDASLWLAAFLEGTCHQILCQSWVRFSKSDAAVSNSKYNLQPKLSMEVAA